MKYIVRGSVVLLQLLWCDFKLAQFKILKMSSERYIQGQEVNDGQGE